MRPCENLASRKFRNEHDQPEHLCGTGTNVIYSSRCPFDRLVSSSKKIGLQRIPLLLQADLARTSRGLTPK
jgi:hypothetical protein